MLLFNFSTKRVRICQFTFKYISCYYLTEENEYLYCKNDIQIHLMLLFNAPFKSPILLKCLIQIHLMLLFNILALLAAAGIVIFKYISCYYLTPAQSIDGTLQAHSNTSHVII